MAPIKKYITTIELLEDQKEAEKIKRMPHLYLLVEGNFIGDASPIPNVFNKIDIKISIGRNSESTGRATPRRIYLSKKDP